MTGRTLTFQGETLTVGQWAERTGISYYVLYSRLKNGWSIERTLTTRAAARRPAQKQEGQSPKPVAASTGGNGESRLWLAVILQAFSDATSHASSDDARAARDHARVWLTRPSVDFSKVCALAGQEPDRVRAQASRLIERADRQHGSVTIEPIGNRHPPVVENFKEPLGTGTQSAPRGSAEIGFS